MKQVKALLKRIFGTRITSEQDLVGYVLRTSAICAALALSVDVVNQLVFSISWSEAFRSWAITIVLAFGIAAVVSRAIGKSHLDLYRAKQVVETLSRTGISLEAVTDHLLEDGVTQFTRAFGALLAALGKDRASDWIKK